MPLSFAPLVVSLVLADKIRKYARVNSLQQWEKPLRYTLVFSVFLISTEAVLSAYSITKWIWHVYLIAMIAFSLEQKELRKLRMFVLAFVPFEIVSLITDLAEVINVDFFSANETYFKNAMSLTYIWMVAILFSQNRQFKAAEKERIKRQQEDELNKAIAIRKVELEGLVAERTAELTAQKEELELTLDELRSTQSQLIQAEKMASLGELTAGIAHEIQNPLNFVNNFSEVSKELLDEMMAELDKGNNNDAKEIASDIIQNLEKINHHGKRADAIVKGMLQHSRSSSGQKEPTDVNALADEFLRLAYHGLRAKDKSFNATLKTDLDANIGIIKVIPQDIGRVILNLLTNAFYAVNERKKLNIAGYEPLVSIRTKRQENKVEIDVSDNGNGIPQRVIDKIFQPFFTTKPTGEGTGLGLSLSYDIIVKGHSGELRVETREGEGTVFHIQLPINA
ncbi:MAG: histidine kinase [Prolixibacteraceae bacterium]|nr:histidine kinase [Prolixibacteraceae bacterium]